MIVAVDFDDTITYPSPYPITGKIRIDAIDTLNYFKDMGIKIILWTCRTGKYLFEAVELCRVNGLVFDAVNENIYDTDSRKVLADVYIDDKCLSIINWKNIKNKVIKIFKENDGERK